MQELDEYRSLGDDLVESSKRWMEWMTLERPEDEPLPGESGCALTKLSYRGVRDAHLDARCVQGA